MSLVPAQGFAALAGVVAGYLAANPEQTEALLDLLPEGPWRVLASAGIGLFVFSLATGARIVRQGRNDDPAYRCVDRIYDNWICLVGGFLFCRSSGYRE